MNGESQHSLSGLVTKIHYQEIEENILDALGLYNLVNTLLWEKFTKGSLTFQPVIGN